MDPTALAQLPYVAFLIVVGGGVFTLLATGRLRWDREIKAAEEQVAKAERSEGEWKAIATTSTATAADQSQQIQRLSTTVATLTAALQAVQQKVGSSP